MSVKKKVTGRLNHRAFFLCDAELKAKIKECSKKMKMYEPAVLRMVIENGINQLLTYDLERMMIQLPLWEQIEEDTKQEENGT